MQAIERVAVGMDRVGFLVFSNLGPKKQFLRWLPETIRDMWNYSAPYIAFVRRTPNRKSFVPYFEKMAYESFRYLIKAHP